MKTATSSIRYTDAAKSGERLNSSKPEKETLPSRKRQTEGFDGIHCYRANYQSKV